MDMIYIIFNIIAASFFYGSNICSEVGVMDSSSDTIKDNKNIDNSLRERRNGRQFYLGIIINNNVYRSDIIVNSDTVYNDSLSLSRLLVSEYPDIIEYGIVDVKYIPETYGIFADPINPILWVTTSIPYYKEEDLAGLQYTAYKGKYVYDLMLKDNSQFFLIKSENSFKGRREDSVCSGKWSIRLGILSLVFPTGETIQLEMSTKWRINSQKENLFNNRKLVFRYVQEPEKDEELEE